MTARANFDDNIAIDITPRKNIYKGNEVEFIFTFSASQRPISSNFTITLNIEKDIEKSKENIAGNIQFNVSDADVTISDARFEYEDGSAYNTNVSEHELTDIVKDLVFTEGSEEPANLSSWQNLKLNFDEELNDILLRFKVTNNGTKKLDYLRVDAVASAGVNVIVTNTNSTLLTPVIVGETTNEVEYLIRFSVMNKNQRPS